MNHITVVACPWLSQEIICETDRLIQAKLVVDATVRQAKGLRNDVAGIDQSIPVLKPTELW